MYINDQYLVFSVAFDFKDKHILQNNDCNIILKVIMMVFLFKRQTLFTDHIIDLQILQDLKFSPYEVKYKTPENKYKCQISYLGRYVC